MKAQLPNIDVKYDPQNFRDLFETELGTGVWKFLIRPDNVIRMETASFLERAAVEPLAPGLVAEFGPDIAQDRIKQMIGHMVRQIMEAVGYEIDRPGLRITRESLFSSGARYQPQDHNRDRTMKITPEQRQAWLERTAKSPFNIWLDRHVKGPDGKLDLERLYEVARRHGIEKRYDHLNPGQQRMNIGVMLRSRVTQEEIEAQ
ncbi:hypothetical protein Nwi_0803 [Nitrobacter winogradskyi Nb-255]|uniref:Uncharacterized protein n=1 Tax=Nitrobacter winogradskyi (strain ATCC 25391 / DSM 10237 / CIP 104748 / NCIMB 11846 / Nb-255) TaxID=323098 RepID=Q3SUH3_NITWN|nr:hypothetical protein [Nitrobacter winogradskyi]ABA04068.1 hypothetical protein Nwi_0803 [Nitrobacter winogradskyi Nb-255]